MAVPSDNQRRLALFNDFSNFHDPFALRNFGCVGTRVHNGNVRWSMQDQVTRFQRTKSLKFATMIAMQTKYPNRFYPFILIAVCCAFFLPITLAAQSNIILRDLTLLPDRLVQSFNQDSIILDDGTKLTWDQVYQATVGAEQQVEFDRNLREIGLPLFRLKQRIKIKDWQRLNEIADSLLIRYSGVDSPAAKTVCLAAMKGKLESGQREAAVIPFLMACQKQSEIPPTVAESMQILPIELQTSVTNQLLPVWFDLEAASATQENLAAYAAELDERFPAGGHLYLASFLLANDDFENASKELEKVIDLDAATQQWKALFVSEIDRRTRQDPNRVNQFVVNQQTLPGPKAASAFFDALATETSIGSDRPAAAILDHMKVVALWGDQFPSLASASIYRAIKLAESAKMSEEVETLSAELLRRFSNTYHGKLLQTQD